MLYSFASSDDFFYLSGFSLLYFTVHYRCNIHYPQQQLVHAWRLLDDSKVYTLCRRFS